MKRLGIPLICLGLWGCAGQTYDGYYLAPPEGPTVQVVPAVAVPVAPVVNALPGAMPAPVMTPPSPPLGDLGQPPKPHHQPAKPKAPAKAPPTRLTPPPAQCPTACPAAPPASPPPERPGEPPAPGLPPGLIPMPAAPGG